VYYGVIILVLVIGVKALGVYEDHVPNQDEIKNVLFANTPLIKQDLDTIGYMDVPEPIKGKENIEAIHNLHQQIVTNKGADLELAENEYPDTAFFLYELKNGEKVIRQYEINKRMYEESYTTIYESEEYKRASNNIFRLPVDKIKHLTISAGGPINKYVTFSKTEEIQEILEKIQSDVLVESYKDQEYFMDSGSMIEIDYGKEQWAHLSFRPTFRNLTEWLSEKELLDEATVLPEDISYMQIVEWDSLNMQRDVNGNMEWYYHDPDEIVKLMEEIPELLKVTDKEQIQGILETAGTGRGMEHKYIVSYHYEGGKYSEIHYIDEAYTPKFIQENFNR
jgi:ABC-2 type transport system permease protein